MRSAVVAVVIAASSILLSAQTAPVRPAITGISHLAVYTSDAAATEHYYTAVLGAARLPDPENPKGVLYAFSPTQFVEVLPLPAGAGINRMDHAALNTADVEGMRKYLSAKGWEVPASISRGADGSHWFSVKDPEGNTIQFVQPNAHARVNAPNAIGHHLIHVGFLVHSRAKEDTFYRDILGFRPYWYGGMTDAKTDWVSQQTPDSHDWIEYMLAADPATTGIPPTMSQQTLGVLDHIAIGENSVDTAFKTLTDAGRLKGVRSDSSTKVGKDGKGQLNIYDPDGIRSELMNFHATEKPCCSPFTAEDPAE